MWTIYVSRVVLKVEGEPVTFPQFYQTDKFWYMLRTYNTEELFFDKNSFPGNLLLTEPSKDLGCDYLQQMAVLQINIRQLRFSEKIF